MEVKLLGREIEVKLLHKKKTFEPMEATPLSMLTVVRFEHCLKASSFMTALLPPIVTVLSPLHMRKAVLPIDVTLLGIIIEVRPSQLENVLCVDNQQFTC